MSLQKSKSAKLFAGVTGVAVALSLAIGVAITPASAVTIDELLAQIASLQSQIAQLQGGSSTGGSVSGSITKDLQMGMTDSQVMILQKVLNKSADTQVSASGAGSPGMETSYFGAKTKAAVMKFQAKYGISPVAGYVGPKTRAQLSTMTGGVSGTPGTPIPSGSGLMVSPAAQPAVSIAPESAARVPLTRVTLTASNDGDVTVNGVVVERTGFAQDAVFSGLVLLDENGLQIGISKTLNSNHQATVGEPFVVRAGTSKTVTVAGNMASVLDTYAGQVVAVAVVGVNSSATVSGSLPIVGTAQTINATLTLGSAQYAVSSFDPNTAQTKEVGTTGIRFAGVRVTAGSSEAMRLWSIRFNQTGSASANDLANVKVYIDGTAYPTTVSADGKYFTALFGSGIVLDKGLSKDIYVQGDIVGTGAAGRTVQFDIYRNTDVYITGETYHFGVIGTAQTTAAVGTDSQFTTGTPFFSGSVITVSAGSVTSIAKATSVAAQNIAVNVPNQVLGGFTADIKGEPISVQTTIFTAATSSGTCTAACNSLLTSVSIYDENGAVVAGPVDATQTTAQSTAGAGQTLTFTDTITLPLGVHTYTLKGKIPSSAANNSTVIVTALPASWTSITGQTTGNTIDFTTLTSFAMNTMTIKAAALTVSVSATPSAQNIVAGGTGITFANYQFDASQSGEDVRFSQLPLALTGATLSATTTLTSCQVWDGSSALNTGSNVVNPSGSPTNGVYTFNFDQSLTVTKGAIKTLTLKCNVSSLATSQVYKWGIASTADLTVTGLTSSNNVSETVNASAGQAMTVAGGTLTVTLDSSSPSFYIAAANTTGNVVSALKFHATNEAVNLDKIGLSLAAANNGSAADLIQLTLWDGATMVGTATLTGSQTAATSTLNQIVAVPKDGDKVITVKADLAPIGTGQSGTAAHKIAVDSDTIATANSSFPNGSGASSGTRVSATGVTSSAGVRIQKSFPIFTYSTAGVTSGGGASTEVLTLNVAANSTGEVQLNKIIFTIATSTATFASPQLSGPSGRVASSSTDILNAAGTSTTVYFDNPSNLSDRVIAAGSSKTFTLRGTLTLSGNSGASGSVSVGIRADTTGTGNLTANVATSSAGIIDSSIIWSPSSTTTQPANGNDWIDGYGLGGCFSSAGLGNNCTARTTGK